MTISFVVVLLLTVLILECNCDAQVSSHYTSVGGDFGRSMIGSLRANNSNLPNANSSNGSLWSWGSSPRGTMIVDGNLIDDPRFTLKKLNVINNWLGNSLVDPSDTTNQEYSYTDPDTGAPINTYVDPSTRQSYYTYVDSKTRKLVYVYFNPETGEPNYVSFTPISGKQIEEGKFSLPPVFS